jgi:hypothetical protein
MLPIPKFLRAKRAQRFLDKTIYDMIAERRASGLDTGDLLSMLLMAVDEEGSGGMTDKQVRDEALTLFLAGHETTATALTWTWYLLSQNPEADARMRAEIQQVLGGRTATYDDLPKLRYTEMVLAESLRLYPRRGRLARMVKTDTRVYNYEVQQGAICLMSPYVMHRHPRYWPDPERFDPERFTPEQKQDRPKFAYFPLRRRTPRMYRRAIRLDGRRLVARDICAALGIGTRAGSDDRGRIRRSLCELVTELLSPSKRSKAVCPPIYRGETANSSPAFHLGMAPDWRR